MSQANNGAIMTLIRAFTTTRRNLPHWQDPGAVCFLTWRVAPGRHLDPEDRTLALNAVRHWDGTRWVVYTAVVMPDHVHVLARPRPVSAGQPDAGVYPLADLLHSVKSYSAKAINRRQGRAGGVWQDERYDRIVRDAREFDETWEYIRNNPVAAGLVSVPEEYAWLYEAVVAD